MVRHIARVQEGEQQAETEFLDQVGEALAHGLGAAHDTVAALVELLEIHAFPIKIGRAGKNASHGRRGRVARREEHLPFMTQAVVVEPQDMGLGLFFRSTVRLGHVDRQEVAHLVGRGFVAVLVRGLAVGIEEPLHQVIRHEHRKIGIFAVGVGAPFDGFLTPEAGNPDRRVRFLEGTRPDINVADLIVLAVKVKRAGLGPGANDQIVRFAKARQRIRGVDAQGKVFVPDAAHETGNNTPAGHDIEHGDFFGDPQRVIAERQAVADHRYLHSRGSAGQHGGHNVRRRHGAVGVLVVLVDAHTLEPQLFGIFELVQISIIDRMPLFGIVVFIRERHPGRFMFGLVGKVLGQVGPRHEMEIVKLHRPLL